MNASRAILAMCLLLSGCSSCQRGEEWSAGGGAGSPPGAGAAPGKVQGAPPQASVAARQPGAPDEGAPRPAVDAGGLGTPAAPAAEAGAAEKQNEECVVVADVNPDFGPPPLTVAFTAEAECGQGATYKWDFGDGSPPGTEANPSHTYAKDGDYTAAVTVTAANGATASDEIDIYVEEE